MFPCALPWEEEPKDRLPSFAESNGHTNHTIHARFIHESRTSTQSPTHPTSWLLWWDLQRVTGVFGGRVHLPSLPSVQQMLPAYSLTAQSRPTAGSPTNPIIYNFKAANHLRITPPNHTTYSNFPARLR